MGMFDWVNYTCNCEVCGCEVDDFQSKDGDCLCQEVKIETISNFYGDCPDCGAWVEFHRYDNGVWIKGTTYKEYKKVEL